MWLREINLSQRLTLGFGMVFLFVLALVGVYTYGQQRQSQASYRLTDQIIPRADAASDISAAYLRQSAAARSFIYSGDDRYIFEFGKAVTLADEAMTRLERLPKVTEEGRTLFGQIQPLGAEYTQDAGRAITLQQQGNTSEALVILEQDMISTRDLLLEKTEAFASLQLRLRDAAKAELNAIETETARVTLVVTLLVFVSGIIISYFTARSVTGPARTLVSASKALAGGDFTSAISMASRFAGAQSTPTAAQGSAARSLEKPREGDRIVRDEMRVLAATFASMAQALLLWERRREARAALSSALAASIDVEQLASEAVRQIAKFTNAEFGLVYAHDPETMLLRRISAFALDGAQEVIGMGEGIPGEAAASRQRVLVRDIPADAPFKVRFGFDQVPPKAVLAMPMVCQDQLVGTIVLGSLHNFSDDGIEFTETSAQQLAISLQNAIAHHKVQVLAAELSEKNELLTVQNEELQAQAEEIQSQNEELQTQNEELQAQAEEIQSQSEELGVQNEELAAQRLELVERNEELIRLRQKAETERQNLQTIIDSIPEGIVICNAEGRIISTNNAADELYRRPVPFGAPLDAVPEELQLYRSGGAMFSPEELPLSRSALEGVTLTGVEVIIRWPTGEERTLLCSTAPLLDHQGEIAGAVGVFQDISVLKEIDQLKDEFLSVASHELKSPLTSLKGFAQLLEQRMRSTPVFEEVQMPLQTINGQVDKVVWIVNRLLDLSRVRLGRLELRMEQIDLAEVVRHQVQQAQIRTNRHRLTVGVADRMTGNWDRGYIEQVVSNLLENAIRYSPNGGEVRIALERVNDKARLTIADQGIGIPQEALPNLFQRYYRSEQAKRLSADGMGIGLYITHAIVTAHKGRISVESEPDKGSVFTIELPVEESIN